MGGKEKGRLSTSWVGQGKASLLIKTDKENRDPVLLLHGAIWMGQVEVVMPEGAAYAENRNKELLQMRKAKSWQTPRASPHEIRNPFTA